MGTEFDSQVTFCYTGDLQKTSDFYENVLGLDLVLDQGFCRIYRTAEKAFLGFCQRTGRRNPDGVILTLVTEDVDGWFNRLVRCGVEIESGPVHNTDFHIYHFFFNDPNGYVIEIQRFEDNRWKY